MKQKLISLKAAAKQFGVPYDRIRRLADEGQFKSLQTVGTYSSSKRNGWRYVDQAELTAMQKKNKLGMKRS